MVATTLRAVDPSVAFKAVTASRGKTVRAEPISALYEQNRVHHLGSLARLEDQMCGFSPDFSRASAGYSPDRVDALVWGLTELMIGGAQQTMVDFWVKLAANKGKLEIEPAPASEKQPAVPGMTAPPPPLSPTVIMKAPNPHMQFYVNRRRYVSDATGFVHDVLREDIDGLCSSACWQIEVPVDAQ